jgi:hypothetical protein
MLDSGTLNGPNGQLKISIKIPALNEPLEISRVIFLPEKMPYSSGAVGGSGGQVAASVAVEETRLRVMLSVSKIKKKKRKKKKEKAKLPRY